jgi:hypothetical protein
MWKLSRRDEPRCVARRIERWAFYFAWNTLGDSDPFLPSAPAKAFLRYPLATVQKFHVSFLPLNVLSVAVAMH